ncbi:MAG: hypothetical protein ACFFDT_10545 [Candidatus Hodarchaeota archaeon]
MEKNVRKVLLTHEFVQKTLDEERVYSFLKSLEGVIGTSFPTDEKTILSEISLWHGNTHYLFRWGDFIAGVFLTMIESKKFNTILTETIFEIEGRFGEQLQSEMTEALTTEISEVVTKNFSSLIFSPVEDLSSVNIILQHKDSYFVHTGNDGFEIYESRKHGAAIGNFVNSYPTITLPALDEIISFLRTDLLTVSELEKRTRLLSPEDLALTLRQLLRLGIINAYEQREEQIS